MITTSWDDGHPLDLRVADLLARHGLRGTFYIPRSFEAGTMTPAEIRGLSDRGFEVGAHTLDHVDLKTVDESMALHEIGGSKAWVEDLTGRPCRMFCPPKGRFNRRDLRLAQDCGFDGLRTVELMSLDYPRFGPGILVMPTSVQAHPHEWSAYARNGLRRLAPHNLWRSIIFGRSSDWTGTAAALVDRVVKRGGVFHLWGHSWELQEYGQWRRLEEVLRLLSQYVDGAPALTNGEVCGNVLSRQHVVHRPVSA